MGNVSLKMELSQSFVNDFLKAVLLEKVLDPKLVRVVFKDEIFGLFLEIKSIVPISPWEKIKLAFKVSGLSIKERRLELKLKSNFKSLNILMKILFPILKKYIKEIDFRVSKDMLMIFIDLPDSIPDFSKSSLKIIDKAVIIDTALCPGIEYIRNIIHRDFLTN